MGGGQVPNSILVVSWGGRATPSLSPPPPRFPQTDGNKTEPPGAATTDHLRAKAPVRGRKGAGSSVLAWPPLLRHSWAQAVPWGTCEPWRLMEAISASLNGIQEFIQQILIESKLMFRATKFLPDASPVLSLLQNVRGFPLCSSSALTIPLRLSFPEEAFIQSSSGGHAWGPGMEALPVPCFPVLEVLQALAVLQALGEHGVGS